MSGAAAVATPTQPAVAARPSTLSAAAPAHPPAPPALPEQLTSPSSGMPAVNTLAPSASTAGLAAASALASAGTHDADSAELVHGVLHFQPALRWPVSELKLALSAQCQISARVPPGTEISVPGQCQLFSGTPVTQCSSASPYRPSDNHRRSEFGGEESPNRTKMHVVSGVKPGEALLTVTERF